MVCESLKIGLYTNLPSRIVHTLELGPSSIYRDFRTRSEGCVNRQESHSFGNFLRSAEALHRNALRHLSVDLIFCLLRHSCLLEYVCLSNWSGIYRVHTDSARR